MLDLHIILEEQHAESSKIKYTMLYTARIIAYVMLQEHLPRTIEFPTHNN